MNDRIIVAIDAGGTSTRCVVASSRGAVLGTGRSGPGNHILAGWDTARTSLADAVSAALREAGTAGERIDVAVVGSSGVGSEGQGGQLVEWLLAQIAPAGTQIVVTGDMVTALWGALQPPVGVVVCAGTGSVCFGRSARGRRCQVGGWGHILGDEGSAYDIAVRGLRGMARAVDGRAGPTALVERLVAALDERTPVDAAVHVYGKPLSREQIAALAVHVGAAAHAGDAVAQDVLRTAGEELGLAATTALRMIGLIDCVAAVSFTGSVFDAGAPVFEPFRAVIERHAPLAEIHAPLLPPVGGAFCLGVEAMGESVDAALVSRLGIELNREGL